MISDILHNVNIALDIIYCIWFILMVLLFVFSEGMSGMDHSSDSVLHLEEIKLRKWINIIGLFGTIIGLILLFKPVVYIYYQLIFKCILFALFILLFIMFPKIEKECVNITVLSVECFYGIILILHVVEFIYK